MAWVVGGLIWMAGVFFAVAAFVVGGRADDDHGSLNDD